MTVAFETDGQAFVALNGGPVFQITPAVSFVVNCRDRTKSTATGRACRKAATSVRSSAAGCATASACRGRSCRRR